MGKLLELHRKAKKEWEAKQPAPKPLLRSLALAKQCEYFGAQLTKEEVEQRQLMGCRTCNNDVPAYHCHFPGQKKFNDGPYTYKGVECMSCTDWKKKPIARHLSLPSESAAFPEKQPSTLKMLLTVGDETFERVLPGIVNEHVAIWDGGDHVNWWGNVSLMHMDGPAKHYRFSAEHFASAGKRLVHIYSARLLLLNASPFYAVAGGLFVAAEKTAVADTPEMVGVKWAVSIAEMPVPIPAVSTTPLTMFGEMALWQERSNAQ